MFNIPVSTKQILITLIKWWIFIWVQLTLLILCWYRGPGTGVPGPSQKVRGKSTGRAVRWRNSSRCPTLGIKGLSTGYTMLQLVGGWPTPLKNDGVKVSWDDNIPNIWKVIKAMFQTTNQSIIFNMLQRSSRLQTAHLFVACQLIQQPSCVP
jgi:hypothetical protein